ncbi:phBC6A51 family helix-turn-helix protein [Paenibacillus sp. 453mf]|uniref:phBC6A51 family helix-turn-helix protein n=1 Tax=Paenibacillus sp. 453mf TaxID=1761874 RepID=UPI0008E1A9D5|nr:phBC6A51 family helix-turn-helix protein [Paenibacillus sp. 453mf]SFS76373.1 Helix-turn-helix of insertion element transposase [Paenibacillus sp. 453mf]
MSRRRKQLEAQLTPQQVEAAALLVMNTWADLLDDDSIQKRTMQEIADEVGVARSTLFLWKTDESFDAYVSYLADRQLSSYRGEVYKQLVKAIMGGPNGIPSSKAIELYMRRHGLLTDKTEVITKTEVAENIKTDEEIASEIAELDRMVNGG